MARAPKPKICKECGGPGRRGYRCCKPCVAERRRRRQVQRKDELGLIAVNLVVIHRMPAMTAADMMNKSVAQVTALVRYGLCSALGRRPDHPWIWDDEVFARAKEAGACWAAPMR